MSKVTSGNFTKTLTSVAKAFGSMRDGLQSLLVFALSQANSVNEKTKKVNGNYTYINEIISSKAFKGLSMNSVKIYIEAHADVKLENASGSMKFVSLKTRKYDVPAIEKTWYEHNSDGEVKVVVPVTMLASFIKRLEGAIGGEGKVSVAKKDHKSGIAIVAKLKAIAA